MSNTLQKFRKCTHPPRPDSVMSISALRTRTIGDRDEDLAGVSCVGGASAVHHHGAALCHVVVRDDHVLEAFDVIVWVVRSAIGCECDWTLSGCHCMRNAIGGVERMHLSRTPYSVLSTRWSGHTVKRQVISP